MSKRILNGRKFLIGAPPLTIDKIDLMTPPSVLHLVDPTYSSASGAGATMRDYRYEKDQKLKRELKRKKDFPSDIKTKFGVYFFETNLRIDSININNFLDYCNSEDIIELYYKKEYLKVIEILTKESVKYKK